MTDIPNNSFDTIDGLDEALNLNKSRLDELQNQMLTAGYDIANTPSYQDNLTYFEDEIEALEDEINFFKEDKFLDEFFNGQDKAKKLDKRK